MLKRSMANFFFFSIFQWLGNYIKFYDAIKLAYPDIGIISNCDGSNRILQHPADFYDFHVKFSNWLLLYLSF